MIDKDDPRYPYHVSIPYYKEYLLNFGPSPEYIWARTVDSEWYQSAPLTDLTAACVFCFKDEKTQAEFKRLFA